MKKYLLIWHWHIDSFRVNSTPDIIEIDSVEEIVEKIKERKKLIASENKTISDVFLHQVLPL